MDNEKSELISLWVKNDSGERVEKTVQVTRIKFTFSAIKTEQLRGFWKGIGGDSRNTDNFIRELRYYMDTTPEVTIDGNAKLEKECKKYDNVAKKCELLLKELKEISATNRTNLLSMRMEYTECEGKVLPICDPFDYVELMKDLAIENIYDLRRPKKYKLQWDALREYIQRFPPCKKLSKSKYMDLFFILYQPESDIDEQFRERAERTIRKFK